jgi:hypothetical protein
MIGPVISCVGLVFDIVGALMIWRYGLPESMDRRGLIYIVDEGYDEKERAKGRKFDFYAKIGVILLIMGFVGQLAGNIIGIFR